MLSHVYAGNCPGGHGGSNEYVPNGQPQLPPPGTQYRHYRSYAFGRHSQATPAQTSNNVVNDSNNRGNPTGTESMENQQWYQPPQPSYNYVAPSNSREMRNKAEKQRRDRLNSFITELSRLVPLVSKSTKHLDKTSVLRLTANHLRIYQTLVKGRGAPQMELPPHVDQFVLEQLICDQMGGFLLIVSPSGKIIFISHTVETLLGHLQTDLMGQSLYTVTAPEDHPKLDVFLKCETENEQGWRKYFSIKIRRAGPKSETPQYETVRIMGVHRHITPAEGADTDATNGESSGLTSSSMSSSSKSSSQASLNSDILVFFAKLYRPQPLADRLVAASKNEYVTRHLIDGRIIACDQRISLIAGYMIDEVQGHSAFQYMHKEDVRFVMIALRQMYDKGDNRGNSCYRLKSRNGQFIYLRTFGFLEIDDQGIVESFVCVNVQVEEDEAFHHMASMKRRYSAMFSSSLASLPYTSEEAITDQDTVTEPVEHSWSSPPAVSITRVDRTEDPETLNMAIIELMQNLPSPGPPEASQPAQSPKPANTALPICINTSQPSTKYPHLRVKSNGKRLPPSSITSDNVKRRRLSSEESQCSSPNSSSVPSFNKRPPSTSITPDNVKRERLSSEESQCSQLSPPVSSSVPDFLKREEQYSEASSQGIARYQQHQH